MRNQPPSPVKQNFTAEKAEIKWSILQFSTIVETTNGFYSPTFTTPKKLKWRLFLRPAVKNWQSSARIANYKSRGKPKAHASADDQPLNSIDGLDDEYKLFVCLENVTEMSPSWRCQLDWQLQIIHPAAAAGQPALNLIKRKLGASIDRTYDSLEKWEQNHFRVSCLQSKGFISQSDGLEILLTLRASCFFVTDVAVVLNKSLSPVPVAPSVELNSGSKRSLVEEQEATALKRAKISTELNQLSPTAQSDRSVSVISDLDCIQDSLVNTLRHVQAPNDDANPSCRSQPVPKEGDSEHIHDHVGQNKADRDVDHSPATLPKMEDAPTVAEIPSQVHIAIEKVKVAAKRSRKAANSPPLQITVGSGDAQVTMTLRRGMIVCIKAASGSDVREGFLLGRIEELKSATSTAVISWFEKVKQAKEYVHFGVYLDAQQGKDEISLLAIHPYEIDIAAAAAQKHYVLLTDLAQIYPVTS